MYAGLYIQYCDFAGGYICKTKIFSPTLLPTMNYAILSDEELLEEFKRNNDAKPFAELVQRYEAKVTERCRRRLKNKEDAQDVSQEVFLRLLTKSHTYRTGLPFEPWLNTIINNRCRDHIKQDKAELHEEISNKIVDTLEEEVDTEEANRPTIEILRELLEQVSGEVKLILLLKYEQGWSIKTIQESLSLEESAVKQRLKRSRDKLRKLLDQHSSN